jgi:hypothetical protein
MKITVGTLVSLHVKMFDAQGASIFGAIDQQVSAPR